ncbi:MFS transporter [Haloechinothrix sp. LS1_15]|uniref:MFS transporter n=1 Tax=Haloechinothrix sp. LS1_15 TaxID=2652248 RepID=UPI002946C98F|nr:MFS transporter [Haloechinothrix sp. LS1_15]MDV6012740.1 MFS transporter [Haloechinothrix sp. LS1_15]
MRAERAARPVLMLVIGLFLVGETALAPFLPQLFRELFGIDDLQATGAFVWISRLAGLLALPLWGLAARRWPIRRLVIVGLCCAAVSEAALGLAPGYVAFTALAAVVVAAKSALLLAYPALVASYEGSGDRITGVRAFVAVFHTAMVLSTLLGAAIVALPEPRWGISALAVLDLALAIACWRVLGRGRRPGSGGTRRARPPGRGRTRCARAGSALVAIAALAMIFEMATTMIRPFFTEYVLSGGMSPAAAAALFLLPHVSALAIIPLAGPLQRRFGRALLPAALVLAAAGLACQAVGFGPAVLAAGRVVFGAGLALAQIAVDLRMFEVTGTGGPAYAAVQTARAAALFVTPWIAAVAASHHLALPLALAAVLYLAAAGVAPRLTSPTHDKEEHRDRDLAYAR